VVYGKYNEYIRKNEKMALEIKKIEIFENWNKFYFWSCPKVPSDQKLGSQVKTIVTCTDNKQIQRIYKEKTKKGA